MDADTLIIRVMVFLIVASTWLAMRVDFYGYLHPINTNFMSPRKLQCSKLSN